MPVYKYRCKECGHKFEDKHRMSELEGHIERCPECNGKAEVIIGSPCVRFYGKGFTKGGVYSFKDE